MLSVNYWQVLLVRGAPTKIAVAQPDMISMIREQGDSETAVLSRYPSSVTLGKLLPFPNSRTFLYEAIARFFSNNKYNKQVFVIG